MTFLSSSKGAFQWDKIGATIEIDEKSAYEALAKWPGCFQEEKRDIYQDEDEDQAKSKKKQTEYKNKSLSAEKSDK